MNEQEAMAQLASETASFCLELITDQLHDGKISMGEYQQHKAMLERWLHRSLVLELIAEGRYDDADMITLHRSRL